MIVHALLHDVTCTLECWYYVVCFRQELLSLEYKLLQNATECQKHLGRIREWEQKRSSINTTTTLTPIPQEITTTDHTRPTDTVIETESITDENIHVADTDQHPNDFCNHEEPAMLPGVEQQTSGILTSISPDSGTAEMSGSHVEPYNVVCSREEVSTLVADKQRMEAQHRRLERKLQESRGKVLEINEVHTCTFINMCGCVSNLLILILFSCRNFLVILICYLSEKT